MRETQKKMPEKLFIEVKSLAGQNYILAAQVIAVQQMDAAKCQLLMAGGASIACNEAARDVVARLESVLSNRQGS